MTIRKELYEKHVHLFPEGKVIFQEGDPADVMYIIIDGTVEISKRTGMDTSKTLITLKNGDIFGEMALIESKPRSATAIATKHAKLLSLDESLFFNMISKNADFAVKVVRILSERIRRSNTLIQQLSTMNKEHLVFQGLLDFSPGGGQDTARGKKINVKKFTLWAASHIGLNDRDILDGLKVLAGKKVIVAEANGQDILIPSQKK